MDKAIHETKAAEGLIKEAGMSPMQQEGYGRPFCLPAHVAPGASGGGKIEFEGMRNSDKDGRVGQTHLDVPPLFKDKEVPPPSHLNQLK
jgi:hypothetical protein